MCGRVAIILNNIPENLIYSITHLPRKCAFNVELNGIKNLYGKNGNGQSQ